MEQHLRIGGTDEPDLRLLYFRADGIDESLETSFSILLLSLLLIVVCIESYKDKPNNRHTVKLADCFIVG